MPSPQPECLGFFVFCKLLVLKRLVGANGFEPSTSWSRTRRASQAALRPDRKAGFARLKLHIQISTALHPRLHEACPVVPSLPLSCSLRRACDSPFNRLTTVLLIDDSKPISYSWRKWRAGA